MGNQTETHKLVWGLNSRKVWGYHDPSDRYSVKSNNGSDMYWCVYEHDPTFTPPDLLLYVSVRRGRKPEGFTMADGYKHFPANHAWRRASFRRDGKNKGMPQAKLFFPET